MSSISYPSYIPSTATFYASRGKHAADTLGNISRAEYATWRADFLPIEQDILKQLTFNNPGILTDAINSAQSTAEGMSTTMAGVRDRNFARYGIALDSQTQEAIRSNDALNKTADMVNAGNYTRQRLLDRDKELMLSGASSLRSGG